MTREENDRQAQAVFYANEFLFGPLIESGSFELLDLDGDTVRETTHGKGSTTEGEREAFKRLVIKALKNG